MYIINILQLRIQRIFFSWCFLRPALLWDCLDLNLFRTCQVVNNNSVYFYHISTCLKVTITTTLELFKFLTEKQGYKYLLTSRLSQDVLEVSLLNHYDVTFSTNSLQNIIDLSQEGCDMWYS